MLKMVIMFARRPEMPHEEFVRYWTETHRSLVESVSPALGIKRYVQNLNLHNELINHYAESRGGNRNRADGLVELWWESEEDFAAGFLSEEGQKANALLAEDELKFAEIETAVTFVADEREIFNYLSS
ncbi:EthD domain-containing protein [Streptomyces sp. NPDC002623]